MRLRQEIEGLGGVPASKLLLLTRMADAVDAAGVCWLTVPMLAARCGGMSERHVQRLLRELEDDERLGREPGGSGGRGRATGYRVAPSGGLQTSLFDDGKGDIPPRNPDVDVTLSTGGKGDIQGQKGDVDVTQAVKQGVEDSPTAPPLPPPRGHPGDEVGGSIAERLDRTVAVLRLAPMLAVDEIGVSAVLARWPHGDEVEAATRVVTWATHPGLRSTNAGQLLLKAFRREHEETNRGPAADLANVIELRQGRPGSAAARDAQRHRQTDLRLAFSRGEIDQDTYYREMRQA